MHLFTPNYDEPTGRYCGPTAICAVTGEPLSDVKAALRQASGRILDAAGRAFRTGGVYQAHLESAMVILGWHVSERWKRDEAPLQKLTFRQFCGDRGSTGPFIVNVTGHYIAVGWGELCDPFNPLGTEIDRYLARSKRGKGQYRDSWVHQWWKFERTSA